jgi:putative flippase GtrA
MSKKFPCTLVSAAKAFHLINSNLLIRAESNATKSSLLTVNMKGAIWSAIQAAVTHALLMSKRSVFVAKTQNTCSAIIQTSLTLTVGFLVRKFLNVVSINVNLPVTTLIVANAKKRSRGCVSVVSKSLS